MGCLWVQEVNRVSEVVTSLADPSANVIFGAVIDDQVRVQPEGVEWRGLPHAFGRALRRAPCMVPVLCVSARLN
jgi:hypothetical protein